jgi:hypothetical protein
MAITVVGSPPRITWNMFRTVTSIAGTTEEAQINPEMAGLSAIRPERTPGGKFRLPGLALRVTLNRSNTMVLKTAAQTNELLAHEQGHFDLMVVSTRALARELEALEADTVEDLGALVQEARERHAERVQAIDEAYDRETDHSRDRGGQRKWDTAIVAAKSDPATTTILGMPL